VFCSVPSRVDNRKAFRLGMDYKTTQKEIEFSLLFEFILSVLMGQCETMEDTEGE